MSSNTPEETKIFAASKYSKSPKTSEDLQTLQIPMNNFRLQSRQLFLTWPKCPIKKEEALNLLKELLPIDKYIIAEELHEDGTPHLHAYIKCNKKIDIKNPNKLDLQIYHGNYQSCRNINAVRNYCKQEGNYITNIDDFHPIAPAIRVINANNYKEAMNIVKSTDLAKDYLKDTAKYESSVARIHPEPTIPVPKYHFKTIQSIMRWKRAKHSLWICGPTGLGKTEFAKSLFTNPLFVRHKDKLKFLNKNHDGIIFDDMNFLHWPRESQLHIVDICNETHIDVKHTMIIIPKGLPRIFTSNVPIFLNDPAIKRRIRWLEVTDDLRILTKEISNDSDSSSNSYEPPNTAFTQLNLSHE